MSPNNYAYIKDIEALMSEEDKREYDKIFAPQIVAVPPEDARRNICVCPDGEIRVYGADITYRTNVYSKAGDMRMYIASRDGGLSWKKHMADENDIGECVKIPWCNKYITIDKRTVNGKTGIYCLISEKGPGDNAPKAVFITDEPYIDTYLPICIEKKHRIIGTSHIRKGKADYHPIVFVSDDEGESFKITELPSAPCFELKWPHKGIRWENNGAEPSVTEMADGRLWMTVRTSTDYMYEFFSYDSGDTWEGPFESRFHMTLTTPYPYTLSDGRTLLFWNNTQMLPEIDKSTFLPPISETGQDGTWEDVFTNRDASHAAITEDCGKTFIGFRETILSEIRNSNYYRSHGKFMSNGDKSVHQHQAIELPYGKILLCVGQHEAARRLLIFDVRWLYETSRFENFKDGLANVSTHGYLKSICEAQISNADGCVGHCQWNRASTVYPMPSPDGTHREAMQICTSDDKRLFSPKAGMVWNFPATSTGEVEITMFIKTNGLRISLTDRWINPTDETVWAFSQFTFNTDDYDITKGKWVKLLICYNTESKKSEIYEIADDSKRKLGELEMNIPAPCAVSYLHMISTAGETDYEGTYVMRLEKR